MTSNFFEGENSNKMKRKLFEKRKESTEMMANFNRRCLNNLRKNWKIKREDHLLPFAETIFDFIEKELSEIEILKKPYSIKEWHQVVRDEEYIEDSIQQNITILSWVYWQRMEGYETLDVSLSRERLVEDIGCIQQFYNAADGLVLEYQRCFSIRLPIDVMCVYGLYQFPETRFRHFIMVPNQTRYEYIPAWISVAHEVAHTAIDEIEIKYYPKWKEKEEIRKVKIEMGEKWQIKDNIQLEKIRNQLRKGEIPEEIIKVTNNLKSIMDRILSEVQENEVAFSKTSKEITSSYSELKTVDMSRENYSPFFKSLYDHLTKLFDNLMDSMDSLGYSELSNQNNEKLDREILKTVFEIHSLKEAVLTEELSLLLFKNPEKGDVDKFFSEWKRIKRRAVDIAETALRIPEGDTGLKYLNEPNPTNMKHTYNAEHILADVLATLMAGEFYLYSLAFYRFLPSVYLTEKKDIYQKQRLPMSLRLFICLETLKHTCSKEMKNVLNKLEILWIQLAIYHKKSEKFEEIVQRLKNRLANTPYELTVELLWNLIRSIMDEDLFLEKTYKELLEEAEEDEEAKDRFDISYFCYMRHALGNTLKQMLRNPKGFLVGVDCEGNCLEELINLVNDNLIDKTESFTTEKRYEMIRETRKHLEEGKLVFDVENYSKEGKPDHSYYTPRNILSAYAQIYFEDILNPGKNKRNHEKAFNATVMSLAWTQPALERFHDGSSRGREQEG